MWTSITKLEQSCDRLNFMMGIPIKPILFYGYDPRRLSWVKYDFIENANIGLILRLVDIGWKYLLMCCIWWLTISTLILLQGWAQMRPSTLEFCYNLNKMTRKWYKNQSNQVYTEIFVRRFKIDIFSYFNKIILLGMPFAFSLGAKSVLSKITTREPFYLG